MEAAILATRVELKGTLPCVSQITEICTGLSHITETCGWHWAISYHWDLHWAISYHQDLSLGASLITETRIDNRAAKDPIPHDAAAKDVRGMDDGTTQRAGRECAYDSTDLCTYY